MPEDGIGTRDLDTTKPWICLGFEQGDRPDFRAPNLFNQLAKSYDPHTRSIACREEKRFCALTKARAGSDECHTRQNLGRTNGHTCSTLVGTPALAQPARGLAPAFSQVHHVPLASVVPARAYKASPGAPHFTPRSPPPARHPSLAPASSFPPAIAARASATVSN
jgi:hypothetical protein